MERVGSIEIKKASLSVPNLLEICSELLIIDSISLAVEHFMLFDPLMLQYLTR